MKSKSHFCIVRAITNVKHLGLTFLLISFLPSPHLHSQFIQFSCTKVWQAPLSLRKSCSTYKWYRLQMMMTLNLDCPKICLHWSYLQMILDMIQCQGVLTGLKPSPRTKQTITKFRKQRACEYLDTQQILSDSGPFSHQAGHFFCNQLDNCETDGIF